MQGDFRIGAWLIQPQLHTISRDAQITHVEPKAMQVLVYLAEHTDEVVTKERLIRAVWADTFVTDDVLTRCISELRKAFNDDAKDPQIIETVPRSGYRLLAAVERAEPRAKEVPAHSRSWPIVAVVALGLVAVGIALDVGGVRTRIFRSSPPQIRSLAVLPLANLSRDQEQEYFADGMTDELITDLAKIGALRVISRTSAMNYKGAHKPLPEIARELNVDAVVVGTVQRSGGRVRISAQLVEARTDRHLWAESYDRDLRDVLALEGEVASAIAREVQVKLTPQEASRLAASRPVNPAAHEAYLRGIYSFQQGRNEGEERQFVAFLSKSIAQFQEAIRLDPNYAQAYAGMARACHWLGSLQTTQQADLMVKSRQAAEKALALDANIAEAHAALGFIAFVFEWDFPRAEQELRRAINLSPNYEEAHHTLGLYLSSIGRHPDALSELSRARELDPSNLVTQETLGMACACAGQYDRAIGFMQNLVTAEPNGAFYHYDVATAFLGKGEVAPGLEAARRAVQLEAGNPFYLATEVWGEAAAGNRAAALRTRAKLESFARQRPLSPTSLALAEANAALGDNDKAFEALKAAMAHRDFWLVGIKCRDVLRPLHGDPRFSAILKQIGLPE